MLFARCFVHSFFATISLMINDTTIANATTEVTKFFGSANAYRSLLVLIICIIVSYWLSKFIALGIIKFAQIVAAHSDNESDGDRVIRLRQVETYLSVAVAAVRAIIVSIVAYIAWSLLSPKSNSSIAAIGAGTVFVVFAGQTVGILLRDITAGATMIIEKWFNVGDFIKIEPFADVSGVVERFTLRSTRLRSLSGEVVWIHNQQMMAVHVTPNALRTMAVDVFVRDRVEGEKIIERVINSVPTGPTMLARPMRIKYAEKWDNDLWRITVVGQTPPGREWLIDKFFVGAIKAIDDDKPAKERVFVHEPLARFADSEADRRFKRAVRVKKNS